MNNSNRRLWILGAIAIAVMVLLVLLLAPSNNMRTSGSTYSRSPDGYGAWYAFMEARGTPIQRWEKPQADLAANPDDRVTLVRIYGPLMPAVLERDTKEWVERGNTLVLLGVRKPVTRATFTTTPESQVGKVKVETRRRERPNAAPIQRLSDRFGAIVWEEQLGEGGLIRATTPYLGANAYQDEPGNYEFLAQLVTESGHPMWVDEYIHGYRDTSSDSGEVRRGERGQSEGWIEYFARTPWRPILLQVGLVLLVAIVAGNRRFGRVRSLVTPAIDNNQAYIQALAAVLRKARSSEFVLETVSRAEQLEIQKALGLGSELMEVDTLAQIWADRTGRRAIELQQLLDPNKKRRWSEAKLLSWLKKWQTFRQNSANDRS